MTTRPTPQLFSVDVEEYFQVTALERVAPRDRWPTFPARVEANVGRLLELLARHGTHATFFTLGWIAKRYPRLVREIVAGGHELASHGYDHRLLTFEGPTEIAHQGEPLGTAAIERASGVRPRLFRAPHGFRSPWVTPIAPSLGQRTVGWSLGVWDSDRPGVESIVQRTVRGARAGSILLLHDGDGYDPAGDRMQTARAVPVIVDRLLEQGFRFSLLDAA